MENEVCTVPSQQPPRASSDDDWCVVPDSEDLIENLLSKFRTVGTIELNADTDSATANGETACAKMPITAWAPTSIIATPSEHGEDDVVSKSTRRAVPYKFPSEQQHVSDIAYGHYFRVDSVIVGAKADRSILVYDTDGVGSLYITDVAVYTGSPAKKLTGVHLEGHFLGEMYYQGSSEVCPMWQRQLGGGSGSEQRIVQTYWGVDCVLHYKWALDLFYREMPTQTIANSGIKTGSSWVLTAARMRMEPHVLRIP